ncbi:receptor-like protein EIX2 [Rutidosis leptorrhynchoides]|uniref:receptor-like protein EIX2 n=1 Tax=Rutidosis leptorrhynchoides TaxID=125765 RepID=UPI003A9A2386
MSNVSSLQTSQISSVWRDLINLQKDDSLLGILGSNIWKWKIGDGSSLLFWFDAWADGHVLKDDFPSLFLICFNWFITVKECRLPLCSNVDQYGWNLHLKHPLSHYDSLKTLELSSFLARFKVSDNEQDQVTWMSEPCDSYSVADAVRIILQSNNIPSPIWPKVIWRNNVPSKVMIFHWLAIKQSIPVRVVLSQRHILPSNISKVCIWCLNEDETVDHLLLHCTWSFKIWAELFRWWNIRWVIPRSIEEFSFDWYFEMGIKASKFWRMIGPATLWAIWIASNDYIFNVIFALLRFCLSNQTFDDVLCKDVERKALVEFKHDLVDESDQLASWVDDGSNCCKWAGIVCDNITGHVHQIRLPGLDGHCDSSSYGLRGNLSSSLLNLKQLEHLDLSCNDFEGIQVPSFIGSLRNVRHINLSYSKFSGIIPPQLGNLSELNVLSLGRFGYEEARSSVMNMNWLSSLRLLRHLEMNRVDLSKATDWFQVINKLPSLIELHFSDCRLTEIHPLVPSLNNLTSLTILDLSYNNFNSSVPRWLFSITSLVSLDLSGCNLQGATPGTTYSFRNLTSLESLHVSENSFMNSSLVLDDLSSTIGSNLVSLDISYCGISSSVVDSIYNLTSLQTLDLSENQITETIPPNTLGNLCNLREISLGNNDFRNFSLTNFLESFINCKMPLLESLLLQSSNISGHLLDQLGKLIHLKYLDIEDNLIAGTIPYSIGQLSSMKLLSLSGNQISGPIPFSIGRLSSLEALDLSDNKLNGSIPDSLGQLSSLSYFDVSHNLLKGIVTEAHFEKLVNLKYFSGKGNNLMLRPRFDNWVPPFQLEYLYLNSWVLGPQFPAWLQLQKNLIALDISNTQISEFVTESFWRSFPNISRLYMSKNHIQGTLSSIPETLRLLDISSNVFSGNLTYLSNGSFPNYLDLSSNFFAGSLHQLMCSNGVKATQVLNLGNNYLSGVIPQCWDKWPSLWVLNLENNSLSGTIPTTLGSLSNLQSLNIRGNKISGNLPDSLMNLTYLVILQLGRNELVGTIPTWIGTQLTYLKILNLRSNNFHGNIPRELCYLTSIKILDVADNNLVSNIPRCFNNFSVLSGRENISPGEFSFYWDVVHAGPTIASDLLVMKGREDVYSTILELVMLLDLSGNNLVGNIPSELTSLVMLKSLNLSRNQLTGMIPEKIGEMKSLETFDVSLNELSGELPVSLSSLSFLSSFNVSYNRLTGRIPLSTQLQSLNESCFLGNNLCGDPLFENCEVKVSDTEDENKEDGLQETDWVLIISTLIGFIVGFWIVVTPLLVSRSWRNTYFRFISELRNKFGKPNSPREEPKHTQEYW